MSDKQLTLIERASAALALDKTETELIALAQESRSIVEITNRDGLEQCHRARMVLKNLRVEIKTRGKEAREDATRFSKAVIAEETRLIGLVEPEEKRLECLEDTYEAERERERQERVAAELRRTTLIRERIEAIEQTPLDMVGRPSAQIALAIKSLMDMVSRDFFPSFQEFEAAAMAAHAAALDRLHKLHDAAQEAEEERARLAEVERALARQREEQARVEAEARAKQQSEEREAKKRRDEEERRHTETLARQRADAEREAAERKRVLDEQEARLAEQRAEIERQQAELTKAQTPPPHSHIGGFNGKADECILCREVFDPTMIVLPKPDERLFLRSLQAGPLEPRIEDLPASGPAKADIPRQPAPAQEVWNGPPPSAYEIISVLADEFCTSPQTVLGWLRAADFSDVRLMEAA